jgi:superfamily I DNA/RNA helicase
MLSTVHKAKGLEADNVFIICPELLPMRMEGQQEWEYQQELNLKYVAVTRAKKRLVWVDVDEKSVDTIAVV